MFKSLKHHLTVAGYYLKLSIMKQLEYPLDLICTVIMIPMMYGTGLLLLYFMIEQYQTIGGWGFAQLAFLYGLGDLSHGLMMVFSVQSWFIGNYVLRGDFDRMLLRPMGVFFQFGVMYFNLIGLMDVLVGGTIFFYACSLIRFEWTLLNTLKVMMTIIGAALIRSAIFTIFCSSAFWTKRNESVVTLVSEFMERTTLYPMSIYPYAVQMALTVVLPIAFISFYPACDLLGLDGGIDLPIGLSFWTLGIGILMFYLSRAAFYSGLKKYESAGS